MATIRIFEHRDPVAGIVLAYVDAIESTSRSGTVIDPIDGLEYFVWAIESFEANTLLLPVGQTLSAVINYSGEIYTVTQSAGVLDTVNIPKGKQKVVPQQSALMSFTVF